MQILQLFIVLRQPVVNSVTLFSNRTKLTNYLFMQWICASLEWWDWVGTGKRMFLKVWDSTFPSFFTGNIRFPGIGIRERRPLICASLTKTGKIQNVHTHIKQLKYNARKTGQIKYRNNCFFFWGLICLFGLFKFT